MKKIVKLGFISLAVAALAGCSTLGLGDDSKAKSETGQSENVNASQTSAKPTNLASNSTTSQSGSSATAPTAKISLRQDNKDQVKAIIYTTYNNNPSGSVKLQWQAPEGTKCNDTSFPITKYREKNDRTWASVKVRNGKGYCTGTWKANVLYNNQVIATDSISVR